jgi:hypothetical protein
MAGHPEGRNLARAGQMAAMALLAALSYSPVAALAQSVPLPAPRPAATTGSILPGSKAGRLALPPEALLAQAQAPRAQAPNPITNPFAALLGKSNSGALNPQQRAIIDRVNNYLSGIQVLSGRFVQVGPNGARTQGDFYISKPGRVRFEYDDPSPIELIADGQSVVVRDRKLATQDVYPLSQTPLRFLLADHVDLMKDSSLTAVYADDVFISSSSGR